MTIMECYLNMIQENRGVTLYHSSSNQGMTVLNVNKSNTFHDKNKKNAVYASDDISYAAGFVVDNDLMEDYGKVSTDKYWTITIKKENKSKLNVPCSMYIVLGDTFNKVKGITTPEYVSYTNVKIDNEIRFRTITDCLYKYGVKITYI